ncbi:hypothetical protein DFH09DRAFT_1189040 [Mycena vulgaris]|nr:hypothetical protein DFH09DRAFT_1189040 [Mycena vulgaris]
MEYFGDFLKRSTSSIKKLALHVRTSLVHNFEEQLVECIRLIPSLTHIELHGSKLDKPIADALFSALSDPSGFLPNLLSIKIGHFHVPLSNNSYDALYRALSLRHPPIICFELMWTSRCNIAENWLDVRLLAAFRQLLAEGMKIHIGSKHRNFISV